MKVKLDKFSSFSLKVRPDVRGRILLVYSSSSSVAVLLHYSQGENKSRIARESIYISPNGRFYSLRIICLLMKHILYTGVASSYDFERTINSNKLNIVLIKISFNTQIYILLVKSWLGKNKMSTLKDCLPLFPSGWAVRDA